MADRVGVVGANPNRGWARDSDIPALRSLENVPLAAVATTSRASADAAAEAFGVGAGYDDPRCVVPCGVCVDRLIRRRVHPASAVDGHMIASDLGRDLRRRAR